MDERNTLGYDWKFGHEELALVVDAYSFGNRLYIGLYQLEEDEWELFDDLTVNLPDCFAGVNEAFLCDSGQKEKLQFIKKHKLGKVLPDVGYSGYCRYIKVAFDLERLSEFDKDGVKRYKERNGIQ